MAGWAVGNTEQIDCRHGQQPQRFNQHAGLRVDLNLFAQQAIEREAERQRQGDDRQRAKGPELYQHATGREADGNPLHTTKAFT